jgi:DNA modification methylase
MTQRVERIGDCTLYLGDCLDILPTLGPVDAVVTDPPYGLNYKYNSYTDELVATRRLVSPAITASRAIANRVVLFPGVHNVQSYPEADWIGSWSWRSTSHFGKCGYSMWQPFLFYGNDLKSFGNVNGITKTDSIHFPDSNGIGFLGENVKGHPCPKPLKLMEWMVRRFSDGVVVDPFMGSGTTGVACAKLGRRFIGIEIDEGYFDIACERIRKAYDQPDFFVDRPAAPVQETFGI